MKLDVVYHSSDLFAQVVAVSIVSLLENNKKLDITVYLIESNISETNKEYIKNIVSKYNNVKLNIIPLPNLESTYNIKFKQVKKKWNVFDSFCRLYLGTILPLSVEKVLYLDSDTLVLNSLEELIQIDLKDNYFAAVKDCLSEGYYDLLGLDKTSVYCNSGMMYFNLKKWRDEDVEKSISSFINKKKGYIFFMEQSVMNIVCQNRILILSPKYNVSTLMLYLSYKQIQTLRKSQRFYSELELIDAVNNPHIVHLTGLFYITSRPWYEGSKHPMANCYLFYRNKTLFKSLPLFVQNSPSKKMLSFIFNIVPKRITLPIAGFLYNKWRVYDAKKKMKKYSENKQS